MKISDVTYGRKEIITYISPRLTAIFVLGKMPKIEPINIFSPSFHQKFSMIILSNIFENEHFRINNGQYMPFFRKSSFLGGDWGLYHRIIQKLLEL